MAIQFPSVIPSSMSFDPPEWPVGEDVSIGGVYTVRRFGNKPSEGRLTVEFTNIPNAVGAEILAAHFDAKNTTNIVFSDSFFQGAGPELLPYLDCSIYGGLKWYFVKGSPPRFNRVQGATGLSNCSLELRARLLAG